MDECVSVWMDVGALVAGTGMSHGTALLGRFPDSSIGPTGSWEGLLNLQGPLCLCLLCQASWKLPENKSLTYKTYKHKILALCLNPSFHPKHLRRSNDWEHCTKNPVLGVCPLCASPMGMEKGHRGQWELLPPRSWALNLWWWVVCGH